MHPNTREYGIDLAYKIIVNSRKMVKNTMSSVFYLFIIKKYPFYSALPRVNTIWFESFSKNVNSKHNLKF